MTPTRPAGLLAVALVCAAAAWLAVRAAFAGLPPLPWTTVPALVLLAIWEMAVARNLRSRMGGAGKPVAPMAVARVAALAKASSFAAAAFAGLAAGFLAEVSGQLGKTVPRHDAIASGATLAAAIALAAAALYLERCCRAPGPRDESDPRPGGGERPGPS